MSGENRASTVHLSLLRERPMLAVMWLVFVAVVGLEAAAPALPRIASTLGVSDARIGLVMSAFIVPSVVVLPVAGVVADLHGRRPILLASLLLFGAAGTAIAFVDSFPAIVALRLLQGVGFAALVPVPVAILGDFYDGARGAAAQGFRISASGLAMITIPGIAGALAGLFWGYPFLLHLAAFPIAALVYLILPESHQDPDDGGAVVDTLRTYWRALRREFVRPDVAVLMFGGVVHGFLEFGIVTYVPLYAERTLGTGLVLAGGVLAIRGVVRIVVAPLAGSLTAVVPRRTAMLGTLGLTAVSPALLGVAPTILVVALLVGSYTVGDALFSPLLKDTITTRAADADRAGVVTGMYVLQNGASALAPAVLGVVLATAGFESLFLLTALVPVAYAPFLYYYL